MATLADWFRANKLSLNLSKTNCILFRKKGQPIDDNFQLVIGNEIISLVKDAKFLGLFIDENLTWRAHIAKIRHKISSGLYMLNNTRNFLPSDQKKTVYMSFVNSHILYGILLWGTMALTGDVSKLSRQQNKAMRAIDNKKRNFPANPLYKKYNILKLEDLISLELGKLMYGHSQNALPLPLQSLFQTNAYFHNYFTRGNTYTIVPKHQSSIMSSSFLVKGPSLWQSMSYDLKRAPSIKSFIKRFKDLTFSKY